MTKHFIALNNLPCTVKNEFGVAVAMVSNQTRDILDQKITGVAVAITGRSVKWFPAQEVMFKGMELI